MTGDRVNNPKGGKIQTASGSYHSLCTVSLRHAFVKEGDGGNIICADMYTPRPSQPCTPSLNRECTDMKIRFTVLHFRFMMAPSLLCEDILGNGNLDLADNYDYDKVKVVTGDFYNNNNIEPNALRCYPAAKCLQLKLSGEDTEKVDSSTLSRDNSEVGSRLSYVKERDPDEEKEPPRPLRHPRSNLRRAPSQASMHHTTVPQALKPSTLGSRNDRSHITHIFKYSNWTFVRWGGNRAVTRQ